MGSQPLVLGGEAEGDRRVETRQRLHSQAEDYAVATLVLGSGMVVRLACSWGLPAGTDAIIRAEFYGEGGERLFAIGAGPFTTSRPWCSTAPEARS